MRVGASPLDVMLRTVRETEAETRGIVGLGRVKPADEHGARPVGRSTASEFRRRTEQDGGIALGLGKRLGRRYISGGGPRLPVRP